MLIDYDRSFLVKALQFATSLAAKALRASSALLLSPLHASSAGPWSARAYEKVTGHKFEKAPDSEDLAKRIENNIKAYLK